MEEWWSQLYITNLKVGQTLRFKYFFLCRNTIEFGGGGDPKISATTTHLNAIHQSIMGIELHCKYEGIDT